MVRRRGKNRRKVDVRQRAEEVKLGLLRAVKRALTVLVTLAVVVGLALAGFVTYRWALSSPTFALRHVTYAGNERATSAELAKLSGLSLGQNIFKLDLPNVRRSLLLHPWVKSVSIERHLPRGLSVQVKEHVPKAMALLSELYLINAEGVPFKRVQAGDSYNLPLITGLDRDSYVSAPEETQGKLSLAMRASDAYQKSSASKVHSLSEVRLTPEGICLVVGSGQEIYLGEGALSEKMARLSTVWATLESRALTAETIRLDNRVRPGWVAVKVTGAPGSERTGGAK